MKIAAWFAVRRVRKLTEQAARADAKLAMLKVGVKLSFAKARMEAVA